MVDEASTLPFAMRASLALLPSDVWLVGIEHMDTLSRMQDSEQIRTEGSSGPLSARWAFIHSAEERMDMPSLVAIIN